ncbi:cell wall-binding protein [Streptococcus sobrinus]
MLAAVSFIAKPVLADTVETEPTNTSEILMTTNQSQPSTDVETVTPPTTETSLNTLKTELGSQASNGTSEDTVPQAVSSNSEVPATSSADSYTGGDNVSVSAKNNLVTSESKGYHSDEQGNWYYADGNGNKLTGAQIIDSVKVYFDENGVQVKGAFAPAKESIFSPDRHYYDKDSGALVTNRYVEVDGNWYYVDENGRMLTGYHTIDGVEVYFSEYDGHQAKGEFSGNGDTGDFYDWDSGARITGKEGTPKFIKTRSGHWYYLNEKGNQVTSIQIIDGNIYYFGLPTKKYYYGMQSRGELVYAYYSDFIPNSSHIYYTDPETGAAWKNRYVDWEGSRYYMGPEGYALIGEAVVNGQSVYFHRDGKQARGELITENGVTRYYAPDSGVRVRNTKLTIDGVTYSFNADGDGTIISD